MDCLNAIRLLVVLTFVHVTSGQTVTVSGPSRAAAGNNTSLTCALTGQTSDRIQWQEVVGDGATTFYLGTTRLIDAPKYDNFEVTSLTLTESVLTIENAEVDDDGVYRCIIPSDAVGDEIDLRVEGNSTKTLTLNDTVTNNEDMYVATCDAVGGKPQETITWTLNGVEQTNGDGITIVDTNPEATAPLSNSKSVFTFPATPDNNGQTLVCQVSGHQIPELDGDISRVLNIHASPSTAGTNVTVDYVTQGTSIVVSCNAEMQPRPAMRIYSIFSNGTSIHESTEGGYEVTVPNPIEGTQYTCLAGNYLGNTTLSEAVTYDPRRPTIPPTTEPITTEGNTTTTPGVPVTQSSTTDNIDVTDPTITGGPSTSGLGAGAYAGIAIGVIACIVIIVVIVLYLLKPECCPCFAGSGPKSSGSSKPAGSAVGSSNGSERDVESPLNGVKDVTAEEKTKPEAAPRGHGSIQHTNDNPNQDMYAMVDKKPSGGRGGDAPDRGSGPGQNEPQGMLYADLDLSHKAGHTDKHVPKNENDVVVYSSILV